MKEICKFFYLFYSKLNCCFIVRVYEYGFFLLRFGCETSDHPSVHFCSRLGRSLNQEEQLDLLLRVLEESVNNLDVSNSYHNKRLTKVGNLKPTFDIEGLDSGSGHRHKEAARTIECS